MKLDKREESEKGRKGEGEDEAGEWDVAHLQSPAHNQFHAAQTQPITESPNLLLKDFLQERWKGLTAILWGQQLKQERLDELIYLSIMNADHLPTDGETSPMTEFYEHNPVADTRLKQAKK